MVFSADLERSDVNDNGAIDPVPEIDDSDLNTSDSLSLPAMKRRSLGAGKHRKSGFDSKWTHEFKWLEKVEMDGHTHTQTTVITCLCCACAPRIKDSENVPDTKVSSTKLTTSPKQ